MAVIQIEDRGIHLFLIAQLILVVLGQFLPVVMVQRTLVFKRSLIILTWLNIHPIECLAYWTKVHI